MLGAVQLPRDFLPGSRVCVTAGKCGEMTLAQACFKNGVLHIGDLPHPHCRAYARERTRGSRIGKGTYRGFN